MPRKADANQAAIVAALRRVGATVQDLHEVGKGCPDLLVGFRGRDWKFEIKSDNGKLTPDEIEWHERWSGAKPVIVRTIREALEAIGAVQYATGKPDKSGYEFD